MPEQLIQVSNFQYHPSFTSSIKPRPEKYTTISGDQNTHEWSQHIVQMKNYQI